MTDSGPSGLASSGQRIVVVPGKLALAGDAGSDAWRNRLARGACRRADRHETAFERLLGCLGDTGCRAGRGALRLWGQSNERPGDWVAAADPVCTRAGLESVRTEPPPDAPDHQALRRLCEHLNETLLQERMLTLQAVGACVYLRGEEVLPTAALPPSAIDPATPQDDAPAFETARNYYELMSEIQMTLHEHPVNAAREAAGLLPLNDLWLWGGGEAPPVEPRRLPAAFGDDPLLAGYWKYRDAEQAAWPGSLAACEAEAGTDFVAVLPGVVDASGLCDELATLRPVTRHAPLTLLFDDATLVLHGGWASRLRRRDRWVLECLGS